MRFTIIQTLWTVFKNNHERRRTAVLAAALLTCIFTLTAAQTEAATFTVTTAADSGAGSLRDAVGQANATIDDDTINFSITGCPNSICTIALTSGELAITSAATAGKLSVTNAGGIARLVISGGSASRVFFVQSGADLTLDSLTLGNSSGTGTTNAAYNGDGGAIVNIGGTLTLVKSTVSNNTVTISGGGLYINGGTVTLTESTFSGNTASNGTTGSGGGIFSRLATLTINNSTLTNNSATTNGGGIYALSNAATNTTIRNTIIAANAANGQSDIYKGASSVFTSNGNNLIGDTSNGSAITYRGTDIRSVPPLLAPLGYYGGSTPTHELLPNSPAIDAGTTTGSPTTDQRGQARNGNVDIGAFELQPGETFSSKAKFDFERDGKSDLSVFRPSNGTWYLNRSANPTTYGGVQFGVATDKPAPADYDGDGQTDVAVWRENVAGSDAYFYILNSATNTVRIEQFGATGDILMVGDWDGDGKADLATYRDSAVGSQSYFYYRGSLNNPNGNINYLPWGTTGDKPLRGDFDGDGKQDLAVFRPSNGIWYILQSSNSVIRYDIWGLAGDKLIPADYDGDGKTDLAVFRSGVWYILQSANSQAKIVNWGLNTDIAVPADYDGDGRTDVAVYRDGVWYIIQSLTSQISYGNFGQSGDVPIPLVN